MLGAIAEGENMDYETIVKRGTEMYRVGLRIAYCYKRRHYLVRGKDRRVWNRGRCQTKH